MDEELEELIRVMEEAQESPEDIAAAVKEHEALKEAKAKQEQLEQAGVGPSLRQVRIKNLAGFHPTLYLLAMELGLGYR